MTNITETLHDLSQTTYDSVEGYRKAAQVTNNAAIKQAFERRADQRSQTLGKLNDAIQSRGGDPITSLSAGGKVHQMFLSVTEALSDSTEAAIKRVDEGEAYLARKFRDVMSRDDLDSELRLMLNTIFRDINEGRRFSEMLEEQYA